MKLDFVKTIIAIALSALIGWGIFELCDPSPDAGLLAIISGIFLALAGIGCIGIQFENKRSGAVIQITCGVFFFITLIINLLFAIKGFGPARAIIVNMVVFLITLLVTYSIYKTHL